MRNVSGRCYIIHCDTNKLKQCLMNVLDGLEPVGECLIQHQTFAIWLYPNKTVKDLQRKLKKSGITEFYCEEVPYSEHMMEKPSFFGAWYVEHYRQEVEQIVEHDRQEELRQMYDNIQKASELLGERIKNARKEEA